GDAMPSRLSDFRRHVPLRIFAFLCGAATVMNWAPASAAAELLAQATSCNLQSVVQPCVVDTEFGVDTPFGPLANAGVIESISAPPVFGYLGQATAQAGFGHVGTAAELQVSSISPFPEDGLEAVGHANASDTLMFSGGTTVQFSFTLHVPTVDLCGLASGPS